MVPFHSHSLIPVCRRFYGNELVSRPVPSHLVLARLAHATDRFERKVRICIACRNACERFRMALLNGSERDARDIYELGCVNLRVPYTIYESEVRQAMAREASRQMKEKGAREEVSSMIYEGG